MTPRPHRGSVILVLGILSWFVCPMILGITAWIMGNADLKEMDAGRMDATGRGLTDAGRILGLVNVVVSGLAFVVWILFALVLVGSGRVSY